VTIAYCLVSYLFGYPAFERLQQVLMFLALFCLVSATLARDDRADL